MAATYLIFPEKKLVISRFEGPTGAGDIRELLVEIWADATFERTFHILMDFSKAVFRIGLDEVKSLCNLVMTLAEGAMGRAAMISTEPIGTALAMLFSKGLSLFTASGVFSTQAAALRFLNVELPHEPL